MFKDMSKSNSVESTQVLASEQPMPLIPILNSSGLGMNNSSGHHFQEMMPIPSSDSICTNNLSHQISSMLESAPRNRAHRRFYSEIPTFSNDVYFGSNFGSTSGSAGNGVFTSDDFDDDTIPKLYDLYEPSISSAPATFQVEELGNASLSAPMALLPPLPPTPARGLIDASRSTHQRGNSMHQRSQSMVETTDVSRTGMHTSTFGFSILESNRKHISPDELAEIFRVDPRRAKRILANRKAAAKLKERKNKYKAELEDKVQCLQSKVSTLHMQLAEMKREANDLTVINKELQLKLQAIEQNFHLQGALNEVLIGEIEHLKLLTDRASSNVEMGQGQQFYPNYNNNPMHAILTAQQVQQLHMMSPQPQELRQQQQTQDSHSIGNMMDNLFNNPME